VALNPARPRNSRHPVRTRGRFVHEREAAVASLLAERAMLGGTLEVEVRDRMDSGPADRPDITILWQGEVPVAARLGASVLVRRATDPQLRRAIERAARADGLIFEAMSEPRLWTLLGVPS
jgi:hypothetical protein